MRRKLRHPAYPAPEQIESTLARVRRIVGSDNVGRPELLDTHRPDGFVMRPFVAPAQPLYWPMPPKLGRRNSHVLVERERPSPFHAEPTHFLENF